MHPSPPGMLSVSFDVLPVYPNITLDHGIRVVRHKLWTGIAIFHQLNVLLMQLRLSERVPRYNLKEDIIFPLKVATKGQRMLVITPTLRWTRLTNF